jgi:hypothetical protein
MRSNRRGQSRKSSPEHQDGSCSWPAREVPARCRPSTACLIVKDGRRPGQSAPAAPSQTPRSDPLAERMHPSAASEGERDLAPSTSAPPRPPSQQQREDPPPSLLARARSAAWRGASCGLGGGEVGARIRWPPSWFRRLTRPAGIPGGVSRALLDPLATSNSLACGGLRRGVADWAGPEPLPVGNRALPSAAGRRACRLWWLGPGDCGSRCCCCCCCWCWCCSWCGRCACLRNARSRTHPTATQTRDHRSSRCARTCSTASSQALPHTWRPPRT